MSCPVPLAELVNHIKPRLYASLTIVSIHAPDGEAGLIRAQVTERVMERLRHRPDFRSRVLDADWFKRWCRRVGSMYVRAYYRNGGQQCEPCEWYGELEDIVRTMNFKVYYGFGPKDLVQEVAVVILTLQSKHPELKGKPLNGDWIRRYGRSIASFIRGGLYRRHGGTREEKEDLENDPDVVYPARPVDAARLRELTDRVAAVAGDLDPAAREIIRLRHQGWTWERIKDRLGLSRSTAFAKRKEAIQRVCEAMDVEPSEVGVTPARS